jgi:hypothetical protein
VFLDVKNKNNCGKRSIIAGKSMDEMFFFVP